MPYVALLKHMPTSKYSSLTSLTTVSINPCKIKDSAIKSTDIRI